LPDSAVQALAREVISRLDRNRGRARDLEATPDPAVVAELCDALLSPDQNAAEAVVSRLQAQGVSCDMLHVGYIAEAAREMGLRWERDATSSGDVILGAGRVYLIMRRLRSMFVSARLQRPEKYRAVFANSPGETHTLGVTMAADYLRRRGWQIDVKAGLSHEALVDEIGHEPYPIIGLSASRRTMVFPLARLIVALRISNPGAWIMIGGRITEVEPDILTLIDADGLVTDMPSAEAQMEAVMQAGTDLKHASP